MALKGQAKKDYQRKYVREWMRKARAEGKVSKFGTPYTANINPTTVFEYSEETESQSLRTWVTGHGEVHWPEESEWDDDFLDDLR